MAVLRHVGGAMALNLAASTFTSFRNGANNGTDSPAIPTHLLESLVPGFGTARSIIQGYTGIDITYIVTWCVLLLAIISGAQYLWDYLYERVILRHCVSTVSIQANERLNDEVLSWMSAHVVSRGSRFAAAQSARTGDDQLVDPWSYSRNKRSRWTKEDYDEKTPPVKYFPSLGTHWFWFRGRLFMFSRGKATMFSRDNYGLYSDFANGGEPLVLMCFGRRLEPLKEFIQHCKTHAEDVKQKMTAVYVKSDRHRVTDGWGQMLVRPARSLDTINMDEDIKRDIIKDVDAYLHPSARAFYSTRGIPFRRGYLFHGPPGTGKTSFTLALACHCRLDLYTLSLGNGSLEEDDLNRLFALLPPRCVVLLEDIDSAGINRESAEDDDERESRSYRRQVSLSGLLNAIDGTSSQEGRILVMTSNEPEKLDSALVRPGRIDRKVYFGYISKASAQQLFMRMFDATGREGGTDVGLMPITEKQSDLEDLALRFAEHIPEEKITPAELQGFLLGYRSSPTDAVTNVAAWAEQEIASHEARRKRQEEKAQKRAEKKALRKAMKKLEDEIAEEDEDEAEADQRDEAVQEDKDNQKDETVQTDKVDQKDASGEKVANNEQGGTTTDIATNT